MSLIYNGNELSKVSYNGEELSSLTCNGVELLEDAWVEYEFPNSSAKLTANSGDGALGFTLYCEGGYESSSFHKYYVLDNNASTTERVDGSNVNSVETRYFYIGFPSILGTVVTTGFKVNKIYNNNTMIGTGRELGLSTEFEDGDNVTAIPITYNIDVPTTENSWKYHVQKEIRALRIKVKETAKASPMWFGSYNFKLLIKRSNLIRWKKRYGIV